MEKTIIESGGDNKASVATMAESLKARFPEKLRTAELAVLAIQPGHRVFLGTACATPCALVNALENLDKPPPDIELVHFITTNAIPHDNAGRAITKYRHRSFFVSSDVRASIEQGLAEYVPIQISHVPGLMSQGMLPIDVAMIQVSPPDAFGFVSLGVSVDVVATAVTVAQFVIAEVNPNMPRTEGDTTLNVEEIDILVPVSTPVTEYVHAPVTEQVVQQIARYIAGIIDDGSTLQIGLGRIPNEALRYLSKRRNLGIHSDLITDSILPLLKKGILTGQNKSHAKGKIVASFALGSRALYDVLDGNARFSFHPITWVADVVPGTGLTRVGNTLNLSSVPLSALATTGTANAGAYLTGAGVWTPLALPSDFILVQFGPSTARAAGTGDFPTAFYVGRAFTATSIVYQFDTADASGSTTVLVQRNGSTVTGSSLTVASTDQADGTATDAARTAAINQSFAVGDRINLDITAVGTTPGNGLRAWILGTWN